MTEAAGTQLMNYLPQTMSYDPSNGIVQEYDVKRDDCFEHWHCVHQPRVAIRVGPQHDAPVCGSVQFGEDVKAMRVAGDWIQLEDDTESGEQMWVLTNGKYHDLGDLLVPSSEFYAVNLHRFDEMKRMYQEAKDQDRLEDAMQLKSMLKESEDSAEFTAVNDHVKMFTSEKGAQRVSPLDALNSASNAYVVSLRRKRGTKVITREEFECGFDFMSFSEWICKTIFLEEDGLRDYGPRATFDPKIEFTSPEGQVARGKARVDVALAARVAEFAEHATDFVVKLADQPHHKLQLSVGLVTYKWDGVPMREEHSFKYGPCPDWFVEKWTIVQIPDELGPYPEIRYLNEEDMDFMDVVNESTRAILRLSPKEYCAKVLEGLPNPSEYRGDYEEASGQRVRSDLELSKAATDQAKKEKLVAWLTQIGLPQLELHFTSSDYCDVDVLLEMGLDDEDLDFLHILDPVHRRILQQHTNGPALTIPVAPAADAAPAVPAAAPVAVKKQRPAISVEDWLQGLGLGKHAATFTSQGYGDVEMVLEMGLEDSDLDFLSVTEPEEREALKRAAPITE